MCKVILTLFFIAVCACLDDPEVTITQGILKGQHLKSRHGRSFSAFTAIPYAQPPVGNLRFKVSIPAKPWNGVLDATKVLPVCPQPQVFLMTATDDVTIIGDEDCLYLNVYTPQLPGTENMLLPVMFYIHGGGWVTGSASQFGPELLLDKDIVLVTANYRLGPLGFLTTGDKHVLGNDGLKDQSLAIKWTKNNIAKFGGDPENIIVVGNSAGGASAHYHMISPMSRDLINGVIAQSGTALGLWGLMPHYLSTRRSKILAESLNCPTYYTHDMMNCLRKVDVYDLIKNTKILLEWDVDPIIPFKPVIELNLVPESFIPEDPIDTIKSGKAANVPLMTGLTTDEGGFRTALLYTRPDVLKNVDKDFKDIAPILLMYDEVAAPKYLDSIHEQIRKFYFHNRPIDESSKAEFTQMTGDSLILMAQQTAVELHSKYSSSAVYYYLFGYKGSTGFCTLLDNSTDYGVCHADELLYLFNCSSIFQSYEPTETDEKVTELMITLWSNFAKYGNPTPNKETLKWEPVQRDKQNYYYIKGHDDVKLSEGLFAHRAKFWEKLQISSRTEKIRDEL